MTTFLSTGLSLVAFLFCKRSILQGRKQTKKTTQSSTALSNVHTEEIRICTFMARRNVAVLKDTQWMHTDATESPLSLAQYTFHTASSKTKYCNAANCYNKLPGYASMETQEQGTQLERSTEQCTAQIMTHWVR